MLSLQTLSLIPFRTSHFVCGQMKRAHEPRGPLTTQTQRPNAHFMIWPWRPKPFLISLSPRTTLPSDITRQLDLCTLKLGCYVWTRQNLLGTWHSLGVGDDYLVARCSLMSMLVTWTPPCHATNFDFSYSFSSYRMVDTVVMCARPGLPYISLSQEMLADCCLLISAKRVNLFMIFCMQ